MGRTFGVANDDTFKSSTETLIGLVPPPRYAHTPDLPALPSTDDVVVTCQLAGSEAPFAQALARSVLPSTCERIMMRVFAAIENGSVTSLPITVVALALLIDRNPSEIFLSGVMRTRGW